MAWIPCARKAGEGSAFCKRHADAILGAMLGALVCPELVNEAGHFCGGGKCRARYAGFDAGQEKTR